MISENLKSKHYFHFYNSYILSVPSTFVKYVDHDKSDTHFTYINNPLFLVN